MSTSPISCCCHCFIFSDQFLGSKWEVLKPYPINVAEAAGGFIGMDTKSKRKDDFLVFSGFADSWYNVTTTVYAINVTSAAASWREVDPVPVPIGFSHSGCTINANVLYACGGYVGPNPGKETNVCLQYTHGSRKGTQWKILPSLPRGRAGGALFHVNASNSLVFATGATRSDPTDIWKSIDHSDVWELFLNNTAVGWISRKATPYRANHVSYASIPYQGKQKHFVLGGQKTSDEGSGNVADMIEWDPLNRSWTRRANMLFARGHASSSTIPIPGCGMLIAGGAVNAVPPQRYRQTNDISYYDIATNNWTKVGTLPMHVNTPVCDIARLLNGTTFLYCHTGKVDRPVSFRRQISL